MIVFISKQIMKKIIIPIIFILLAVGGFYLYTQSNGLTDMSTSSTTKTAPSRPAEVNGIITSALGNEIKIANEIDRVILTEAEQAAKKAATQKLSPEERAASRQAEKANLKTEEITLIIPVGIPLVKGSGDASGNVVMADIADLSKGIYVSIWTNQSDQIEYVKIKGI